MQSKQLSLEDLKRSYGKDRLLMLARAEGLRTHGGRMSCPLSGCDQKRKADARAASVTDGAVGAVWCCHRCGQGGSAIDLVMFARNIAVDEAVRVLSSEQVVAVPEKRATENVDGARLWDQLSKLPDSAGVQYLIGRGLEGAVGSMVRFNVGATGNEFCDKQAVRGYRVAMPLVTAAGEVKSFQLRCVKACDPAWSKMSLKGPSTQGLMFGHPEQLEACQVMHVAEGMADTLAVALATGEQEGHAVIGMPGVDQVLGLATLLGSRVKGHEFWLYPQNDKPIGKAKLKSEDAFEKLRLSLISLGARSVSVVNVPAPHKDFADYWAEKQTMLQPKAPAQVLPMAKPPDGGGPNGPGGSGGDEQPMVPLQKSYASLCQILRHPLLRGKALGERLLEYNEMSHTPTLGRVEVSETEISAVRERIELVFSDSKGRGISFSQADMQAGVLQVAAEKTYHPVRDYLNGLVWDGVKRIERLLDEVLFSSPSPIKQQIMRWWMISAVARGLQPGCKVDSVLILQGKQGRKKSSFFATLAGQREWFSDTQIDLQNKDAYQLLHSCWIWEWGELETLMRARRMSAVKNFVSSAQDSFRAPYAKTTRLYLRSSIIVGSTNDENFLSDPTGHRRWWVVDVKDHINRPLLAEWRDQLWAEAVAAYRAGEAWYASDDEQTTALAAEAQQYEVSDAWEEKILNWAAAPRDTSLDWQPFSTSEVLESALLKPPHQWGRADDMRVAEILNANGYIRDKNATKRPNGVRQRLWRKGPGLLASEAT